MTSKVLLILVNCRAPWDCGISKGVCLARISVCSHIFQIKVKGTRKFKNLFGRELKVLYTFISLLHEELSKGFTCCWVQNYRRVFRAGFHRFAYCISGCCLCKRSLFFFSNTHFVLNWVRDFQLFFYSTLLHLH